MLWSVCGSKGGVGASVIATALAIERARDGDVLVVDLAGDIPAILGMDEPEMGVHDWLSSDAPADSLDRLAVDTETGCRVLPTGNTHPTPDAGRITELAEYLRSVAEEHPVFVDVGVASTAMCTTGSLIWAASHHKTLVVRACYLALRRARDLDLHPDSIVEVVEPGRALTTIDIEGVLRQPVDARCSFDPAVARAVDSGLLVRRRPRTLRRLTRHLLETRGEA